VTFSLKFIAHKRHRYETVGDYFYKRGVWHFRVSKMKDPRYCWLVFLHEIIEWTICKLTKVPWRAIDRFDMDYEQARGPEHAPMPCGCSPYDEPGDDPHAPYRDAHLAATACEKIIAKALRVPWPLYEEAVEKL